MAKNSSGSQKTLLRKLYDLGSRLETAAERTIVRLLRSLHRQFPDIRFLTDAKRRGLPFRQPPPLCVILLHYSLPIQASAS